MRGLPVVLAFLCCVLSNCSSSAAPEEGCSRVRLSAEGDWLAYLWETRRVVRRGSETVAIQQAVSLCWASTAAPEKINRVSMAEWGRDKRGYSLLDQTHFAFAPKGTRLAVLCPEGLKVVHLATGQAQAHDLKRAEVVTSLSWLDEETVAYTSFGGSAAQPPGKTERTFWRQRMDRPMAERAVIHRDSDVRGALPVLLYEADGWPQEFWSPDGQYVLFRGPTEEESPRLMNAATGQVRALGSAGAFRFAAWSRDSARALYVTYAPASSSYHAYLLDAAQTHTLDLSQELRKVFGTFTPNLEPLWTSDDRFVVGSNLKLGGYLIQPEPWVVQLVGRQHQAPGESVPPHVRGQAVPSVLILSRGAREAAVDYEGKVLKQLGPGGLSGWTILPGGKAAVSVQPGNKIAVAPMQ